MTSNFLASQSSLHHYLLLCYNTKNDTPQKTEHYGCFETFSSHRLPEKANVMQAGINTYRL